jgi:hypothetical protein
VEGLECWRLCDELTIFQAAMLFVGDDPSTYHIEHRKPGFEGTRNGIANALRRGEVKGEIVQQYEFNEDREQHVPIEDSMDINNSRVNVRSLQDWLQSRGVRSGFFFPQPTSYLDKNHQRYAPKLAAAVQAWLAMEDPLNRIKGRSIKHALETWLRAHASELGLTDKKGKTNDLGIEEVAKVANWEMKGGAPTQAG